MPRRNKAACSTPLGVLGTNLSAKEQHWAGITEESGHGFPVVRELEAGSIHGSRWSSKKQGHGLGACHKRWGPSDCKPAMTPTGNQRCSCVQTQPASCQTEGIDFLSRLASTEVLRSAVVHSSTGSCTLLSHTFKQLIFNFCLLVWAEKSMLESSVCAQCGHWEPSAPLHQPSQVWMDMAWTSPGPLLCLHTNGSLILHYRSYPWTSSLAHLLPESFGRWSSLSAAAQIMPRSSLNWWHEASSTSNKTVLMQTVMENKGAWSYTGKSQSQW